MVKASIVQIEKWRVLFSRRRGREKETILFSSGSIKHKLDQVSSGSTSHDTDSVLIGPKQNYSWFRFRRNMWNQILSRKTHPKLVWKRTSLLYVCKKEEKSIDLYSGIKCKSHFTFSQASAWLDIWCKIDISSQVKSIQLRFSAEKYDWEILLRITLEK